MKLLETYKQLLEAKEGPELKQFTNDAEKIIKKYFPTSTYYVSSLGESIYLHFVIGQKKDWAYGYAENAPVRISGWIYGVKDGELEDKLTFEKVNANIMLDPGDNKYVAYSKKRIPSRKTTGDKAKILKAIDKLFSTAKSEVKSNINNFTEEHSWIKKYI